MWLDVAAVADPQPPALMRQSAFTMAYAAQGEFNAR